MKELATRHGFLLFGGDNGRKNTMLSLIRPNDYPLIAARRPQQRSASYEASPVLAPIYLLV